MSALRAKYVSRGFSNQVVDVILKSWRKGTITQYLSYAKLWFSFAQHDLSPTVSDLVEFLYFLHSKGYKYKQLCQARSAVGALSQHEDIGKHPDVKRFMKGLFEKNPEFPVYSCIWDVKKLLDCFRTIPHQRELSLKMLSKKLAILLAILAGGQRSQTVHTIKATDIVVTDEKCIIPIYDVIKQTKDGKHLKPLEFRVYKLEPKLCFVQNLLVYLERTREHRRSSQLFLSYQKPHHPVSKDTVARWVRDMMRRAGINNYVTHSCRAAASSALAKKIPMKKLIDTCGWSSEAVFARHYRKEVTDDRTVGESLLR